MEELQLKFDVRKDIELVSDTLNEALDNLIEDHNMLVKDLVFLSNLKPLDNGNYWIILEELNSSYAYGRFNVENDFACVDPDAFSEGIVLIEVVLSHLTEKT